jgi:hypothetical protein
MADAGPGEPGSQRSLAMQTALVTPIALLLARASGRGLRPPMGDLIEQAQEQPGEVPTDHAQLVLRRVERLALEVLRQLERQLVLAKALTLQALAGGN